jgi:hypothetical protein
VTAPEDPPDPLLRLHRQEICVKTFKAGWFANEGEIARLALAEFVQGYRFELQEQFQRDDILWALSLKDSKR